MKKNIFYICIVLTSGILLYFYNTQTPRAVAICPENYSDTDMGIIIRERVMNEWIDDFRKDNPNASSADLIKARAQFYIENNCNKTLNRYYELEAKENETVEDRMVREIIQEELRVHAMENLINALKEDGQI